MFKEIAGYENYKINEEGVLINSKFNRVMTLTVTKNGYLVADLWKNNKGKQVFIHRLVAQAFLTRENGKDIVNHIDGNRRNNHFSNLEWCTEEENSIHGFKRRKGKNISKKEIMKLYKKNKYTSVEDFLIDIMKM